MNDKEQHKRNKEKIAKQLRNLQHKVCLNNGYHNWELTEIGDVDCDAIDLVKLECKVCSVEWSSDMPEELEEDMDEIRIECGWCKDCNVLQSTDDDCDCVIGDEEE